MLAILFPMIDPVLFSIGPIDVRWYGIAYGASMVIAIIMLKYLDKRNSHLPLSSQIYDDLFIYGILGIILGGRLGYVLFYHPEYLLHNQLQIFKTWDGGMSFHGGILGLATAIWLLCHNFGQIV